MALLTGKASGEIREKISCVFDEPPVILMKVVLTI